MKQWNLRCMELSPLHGIQADQAAAILAEFQNVSNTKLYLPSDFPDKSEHPEMLWILRSKVIVREPERNLEHPPFNAISIGKGGRFGTRLFWSFWNAANTDIENQPSNKELAWSLRIDTQTYRQI